MTAVLALTGGRGVDFAVEAAGRRETMETAFRCVRDHGGLCVLAGNLPHGEHICLNPYDLIRGKRILGTWGGETGPDRDVPLYAGWFREGRLPLSELISRRVSLAGGERSAGRPRARPRGPCPDRPGRLNAPERRPPCRSR